MIYQFSAILFKVIMVLTQDLRAMSKGKHSVSIERVLTGHCTPHGINTVMGAGKQHMDACEERVARLRGLTVVGATDKNDNIAEFSNYGNCVGLYAPGVDVLSADLGQDGETTKYGQEN